MHLLHCDLQMELKSSIGKCLEICVSNRNKIGKSNTNL